MQNMWTSLGDHWPLVVGYLASLWWLKNNVFPDVLRVTLSNGGGDIIHRIVSEENQKQSDRHTDELRRHETMELDKIRAVSERVDDLEDRLDRMGRRRLRRRR